jgi:hypothetical protein
MQNMGFGNTAAKAKLVPNPKARNETWFFTLDTPNRQHVIHHLAGRISRCRHLLQTSSTAISPNSSSICVTSRKSYDPHLR